MRAWLSLLIVTSVALAGVMITPGAVDAVAPGAVGRIVFVSNRDHLGGSLYTRAFAGGEWTRLTSGTASEDDPVWSPDGSRIAYQSNASGTWDIWVIGADGSNPRNLTADSAYDLVPTWSPDGSQIAYVSDASGSVDIWVMDADGSDRVNVTSSDGSFANFDPAWSPDGSSIAFESDRGGTSDIYVMTVGGSRVTNLTQSGSGDQSPAWSPDGSKIAFVSGARLFVMDADGSDVRGIAKSHLGVSDPAWSPDGRHISFTSQLDGDWDLWMVDPDGANVNHLTDHVGSEWHGAWESVNRLPSATDDGPYSVALGGTLSGPSVLSNDTDPDGESLIARFESPPTHAASFALNLDGSFTYVHDGSSATADSFTYRAEDTRSGGSAPATVSIQVDPANTVGLVDPGTGVWRLRNGAGVVSQFYFGDPGDYPFMGDWDCDAIDTPGLYRQSDGFAYLRNSNTQGNADRTFFFGDPGDVPLAGDFNGDGCDTLSIYRPSEARFYIINALGKDGGGLGSADYSFLFGDAGDKPVVGDWDGDGIDEIGLHRETSGFFYYRNSLTTGIADGQFYFGNPGDRFVAGDWGIVDGAETPGLFRPSNTTFYFRHTLAQGNADSEFVWPGAGMNWLPVSGAFTLD